MKFNHLINKLVGLPRWTGPLAAVAFTALYHAGADAFGYSVTLIWLAIFVAVGALVSGLRGGLIVAVGAIFYGFYVLDPSRAIQVAYGMPLLAAIIGLWTRALRQALAEARVEHARAEIALAEIEVKRSWAEALAKKLEVALEEARAGAEAVKTLNTLNGNIMRIKEAKAKIEEVMTLDFLTEGTRAKLGSVVHTLNNLLFATEGWVQLEQLRERQARKTKPLEDSQ